MRQYLVKSNCSFRFRATPKNFFVEELPNKEFLERGDYLVLKIQKQGLSTWELVEFFKNELLIDEIGYAGLKDKNATTIQYISIPKRYYKKIKRFKHPKIKILQTYLHNRPLQMSELTGNRFVVHLQTISNIRVGQIQQTLELIAAIGMPNYFGYQRFGKDGLQQAKAFLNGERVVRSKRMQKFLLFILQSDLFNRWLQRRVSISKNGFELLQGDVYRTKEDRYIRPKKIPQKAYEKREIAVTGLLPGKHVIRSFGKAREIEKLFDEPLPLKGDRRDAIVYPVINDLTMKHKELILDFALPKGSYATILLENLAGKEMNHKGFV